MVQGSLLAGRLPTTFTALRYPNYRRRFIGQVLSLMGTWMQGVAQGWLVYEITGSRLALGTISFASLLAGSLAQVYGTTPTIVFGAAVTLAFALYVVIFQPQVRRLES